VIVRNVNGTSSDVCACGSWLTHWAKFGGQTIPNYCPEVNCVSKTEVGAHVQSANPGDEKWYIVPLCSGHAAQTGEQLKISEAIRLVSADVAETCGK
jgi:hypothetical protein